MGRSWVAGLVIGTVVLAGCGAARTTSSPTPTPTPTSASTAQAVSRTTVPDPQPPRIFRTVAGGLGVTLTSVLHASTKVACTTAGTSYYCSWSSADHGGSHGTATAQLGSDSLVSWMSGQNSGTFFLRPGLSGPSSTTTSTSSTTSTTVAPTTTTEDPAAVAFHDLEGTWSTPGFTSTFSPIAGQPGVLTTSFGGTGTPTANSATFNGVDAGSGMLILTYDFATSPNVITVADGSVHTYPAYRVGTSASTAAITVYGQNLVEPSTIGFSVDGGNIVSDLKWTNWGAPTTVGTGTVDIQGCVPDCADGTNTPTPTTLTLTDLDSGYYGQVTEATEGLPPSTFAPPS
jgi:hypothetical protein